MARIDATALPANINVNGARLPEVYEHAKTALANCASIDECKDWGDKAAALASYARQADDDTLEKMAMRIRARAIRRCGELLKQFNSKGARTDLGSAPTQGSVGHDAGLSERQVKTAVRVANVPEDQFNGSVESNKPPTISQLAIMARQNSEPEPEKPEGFKEATHLIGAVKRFAEYCKKNDPEHVANGIMSWEAKTIRKEVAIIDGWLDRFVVNLKG